MLQAETRKLAAIMFTDIVGFSRQMGSDETRMLRLLDVHNQIIQRQLSARSGGYGYRLYPRAPDALLVGRVRLRDHLPATAVPALLRRPSRCVGWRGRSPGLRRSDRRAARAGFDRVPLATLSGDCATLPAGSSALASFWVRRPGPHLAMSRCTARPRCSATGAGRTCGLRCDTSRGPEWYRARALSLDPARLVFPAPVPLFARCCSTQWEAPC